MTRHTHILLRRAALILALALLLLGASGADTRFTSLGQHLMCTCGCGQVLLECNHVGCQSSEQMRGELHAAIARGDSDDDVLGWFVNKYGPVVLSAPPTTGFSRLAWVMPYLTLVGGIALTVLIVRLWRSRLRPATAAPAPSEPAELDRLRRRIHQETEL